MDIKQYQDTKLKNLHSQIQSLECLHPKIEIRYRLASNDTKMYKSQCTRCGELFGEWVSHHLIQNPDQIKQIDDNLRKNYNRSCYELKKALQDRIREIDKTDFHEWYKDYLKSYEWIEKRKLVFNRCKGVCEGCGLKAAVQVHHKTYANVGKEFLFELLGVCMDCHERIHEENEND